jgi:hypothetical protein
MESEMSKIPSQIYSKITKFSGCVLLILSGYIANAIATNSNTDTFKGVKSIIIKSDEGHINIEGGDQSDVHFHHQFNKHGTKISKNLEDGILTIKNDKNEGGGNCDITFNVPNNIDIKTNLGAGDISINKLSANVDVNLGAGKVKIIVTEIPENQCSLNLNNGAGNIDITLPSNSLVKYKKRPTVGCGKVKLTAPATDGNNYNFLVSANTGMGNITVKNN